MVNNQLTLVSHVEPLIREKGTDNYYIWVSTVNILKDGKYQGRVTLLKWEGQNTKVWVETFDTLAQVTEFCCRPTKMFDPFAIKMLSFDNLYTDQEYIDFIKMIIQLWTIGI